MRILSLKEAGALVGRNTEQLRKLINAGQLACLRSEGERTPIYVIDQAMRDAAFSEFPQDAGDPSVETCSEPWSTRPWPNYCRRIPPSGGTCRSLASDSWPWNGVPFHLGFYHETTFLRGSNPAYWKDA